LNQVTTEIAQSKPEEKFNVIMKEFAVVAAETIGSLEKDISAMQSKFKELISFYGQEGIVNANAPEELFKLVEDFSILTLLLSELTCVPDLLLNKAHDDNRKALEKARKVPTRFARQHGK
jgi:hypothetical protein